MSLAMHLPVVSPKTGLAAGQVRARSCARLVVYAKDGGERPTDLAAPRRAALLTAVPFLLAASPAYSAFIDVDDSRKSGAKESMESADQARDTELDQRRRFSYQSVNQISKNEHQDRAKESYARLQRDVKGALDKRHFPKVSRELGLQIGSLRYDLQQLAADNDKSTRKAAQARSKQAIKALEELDLYARLGKPAEADQAYSNALQKLGDIVKAYG